MVVTDDPRFAEKMRRFRNHGIDNDHRQRANKGEWYYAIEDVGFNYRLSDMQCALGLSQLNKLSARVKCRQSLAFRYEEWFHPIEGITPLAVSPHVSHGYHLYVIRVVAGQRNNIFSKLRSLGIGVNVHYIPAYQHTYYRKKLNLKVCPCRLSKSFWGDSIIAAFCEYDGGRSVPCGFESCRVSYLVFPVDGLELKEVPISNKL